MLKERIQEVFDFTKSESPYRKANKGWINQDIFLDLSPAADTIKQRNEAAKVTLFWSPINSLLSNIFLIIIVGAILVFTSLSFAKGRFNFDFFDNAEIINIVKVEENEVLDTDQKKDSGSLNSTIQQNIDSKKLDNSNEINSSDDDLMKENQKIINEKIDKKESLIKETESKEDVKIIEKMKPKSNFI